MTALTKRLLAILAAALSCVLALSACTGSSGDDSAADGDLVIARAQDVLSLLPQSTTQNADIWTSQQLYETLTMNRADGTGIEPGLATKWEESKDRTSWTFHLRQDVKFHSGKEMNADDVVFSLNYARNTKDETNQWAAEFESIKNVVKVDDYTVRIDLNQPWGPLPNYLALFAACIFPKDFGGHNADYMTSHVDGTGPFKLESWTKGQSMKIVRNDDYWQKGVPALRSVTFNVVADDNTRRLQLLGDQAQVDEEPAALSMNTLGRSQDVRAEAFKSTKILYFNINTKKPGLDDAKLRRALSYAIDRKAVAKVVYAGFADPANSYISPGLSGHSSPKDGGVYDMDKARKLIAESKTPTGMTINIQLQSGIQDREMLAQIAQQAWGDLGIKVNVQKLDAATMVTNRTQGNFEVSIGYATSDVVDTSQMISFMGVTDGSGIRSGYAPAEVKQWAADAVAATDEKKKKELYAKIQQRVSDDAPIIPVVYQKFLYGMSSRVNGFAPSVLGTYGLRTTTLSQ